MDKITQKIGFIGLGHMGRPMASNLKKAGFDLWVYDLMPGPVKALEAEGARVGRSVLELAREVDAVITMLQTDDQVSKVCGGGEGVFAHLRPGALYLDCSTISVMGSRALHQEAKARRIDMVDAPVSGGVMGAKAGTLTFMVGGEPHAFERARPLLEKMGKNIIHAGQAGNGQVAKACNNMILGISMIAVSEGFSLAESLGLDAKTFFKIASTASGQCWSMTSYCPVPGLVESAPSNRDYQPGFTAAMMLKDLKLSQEAAQSTAQVTPLGEAAMQLYAQFVGQGHGELDFSGIIKMLKASAL